jgi:hypothetical protein
MALSRENVSVPRTNGGSSLRSGGAGAVWLEGPSRRVLRSHIEERAYRPFFFGVSRARSTNRRMASGRDGLSAC